MLSKRPLGSALGNGQASSKRDKRWGLEGRKGRHTKTVQGEIRREEGRRKSQWLPEAPPASSMEACPVVTGPLGIHRSHAPCPRVSPWAQFPFSCPLLPRWPAGKESACISIPGSGRSPGGGKGNPLQYSCLGNPTDRGNPWRATVHGSQRVRHD